MSFERQLYVVAGKGGVGRTTLAAGLALAAAKAKKRAVVVELHGMAQVASLFGVQGRYAPTRLADGVDHRTFTTVECLEEFGERKLGIGRLVSKVMSSRLITAFLDAVPGMHDILQLGKLENMLNEPLPGDPVWDVAILDAPATGHGLTLLAAARTMHDMTRVGPFAELAHIIEAFLGNPKRAGLYLATLPEPLPVQESLMLLDQLGPDRRLLAGVIVNQVRPPPIPADPPWELVRSHLARNGADALANLVDDEIARHRLQEEALNRLAGRIDVPLLRVARHDGNFAPSSIAVELEEQLG